MSFVRQILFPIFILVAIFSCKKKDPPESVYVLERDNHNTTIPNAISHTNTITPYLNSKIIYSKLGLPLQFNGIYGMIRCTKPWNNETISSNCTVIETSDDPIPYCSHCNVAGIKEYQVYPDSADPEKPIFEFLYQGRYYRIVTQCGFSNCILDSSINNVLYSNGYINYHIQFEGAPKNTDEILTCNSALIPIKDTIITLPACGSVANYTGKPKSFSIKYSNFEHFDIEGKVFVIRKTVQMYHWTQY